MSPKNYFEIACPLCGHPNRFRLTEQQRAALGASGRVSFSELVACDTEEGGCDQTFAFELTASVAYKSRTFRLEEKRETASLDADRRMFEVRSRAADDPESDATEYVTARDVRARAESNALFRLALEMRDGDDLKFVSTDALSEVKITCREDALFSNFETFEEARRAARRCAINTGETYEVRYSHASARFVAFPVEEADRRLELIARVEPPVVFRIEVTKGNDEVGEYFIAEAHSDDERTNPKLQDHGESVILASRPMRSAQVAAETAAESVRLEFGEKFDVEILCDGYNVEPDEIPFDETPPARRNYWNVEEAEAAKDVDPSRCIHGAPVNVFCVKCEG